MSGRTTDSRHSNDAPNPWTLQYKSSENDEWRVAMSGSKGIVRFSYVRHLRDRTFYALRMIDHNGDTVQEYLEA